MKIKVTIKNAVREYQQLYAVLRSVNSYLMKVQDLTLYLLSFIFSKTLSIKENKIVVKSFYGRSYGGNAKYIVQEILKQNKECEIVWLCARESFLKDYFPPGVRSVYASNLRELYELATAKIWIDDCRKVRPVYKGKEQFYLQTWHSSLRLKKIERDAEQSLSKRYVKSAIQDSKNIDLMISGCDFSQNIYRNSFWYKGPIEKTGTPRCDVFFKDNLSIVARVKSHYSIPADAAIILYAPTFRKQEDYDYSWNFNALLDAYQKMYGEDVYLLIRLHPNVTAKANSLNYSNKVINATYYPDMQDLLCAAEMLITDYSSSMFDMAIARKKCILYTPDLTNYLANERELYFDLRELPFPLAVTEGELFSAMKSLDDLYLKNLDGFLCRIGNYEDGKASSRVAKLLLKEVV